MVLKNKNFTHALQFSNDIIFSFNFFLKYFSFFFILKNTFFFNSFFKYLKVFKYLKTKNNFNNLLFINYHIIEPEDNNFFFSNSSSFFSNNNSNKIINTKKNFKKKIINSKYDFFNFFSFLFLFSSYNSFYKCHHNFAFFYYKNFKKKLIIIDTKKLFNRWLDSQTLIFNIFYYNFNFLLFGSFEFKNEILAVNWQNFNTNLHIWKYAYSFFVFKTNKYNHKIKHFFNKFKLLNVNFFLVSNPIFHAKNLHYFKKFKFYTISIVHSNSSPWLVSYAIPTLAVNFLMEYYFLKLLIVLKKNALFFKYNFFKLNWLKLNFKKNL